MPIPLPQAQGPARPNKKDFAGWQPDQVPEDFRARLLELEEAGELVVQRMTGETIEVPLKYGRTKRVPVGTTWHHKSCGQCGHIPGYSTSIFSCVRDEAASPASCSSSPSIQRSR